MKQYLTPSLLVLVFFIITPVLWSQCVSNEANVVAFELDGINYEIVKEKLNWESAAACAVERGGYLVEINAWEEQIGVFNALNNANITVQQTTAPDGGGAAYIWSGGNDRAEEGSWLWDGNNDGEGIYFWEGLANGSPVDDAFVFWGNEPDNFSNQDALGISLTDWPFGSAGQWNDIREINKLYYVIEFPDVSGASNDVPKNGFYLFPNPAENTLNFEFTADFSTETILRIFNTVGALVFEHHKPNNTFSVDVGHLNRGIYFVQYQRGGVITTKKVPLH